MRVSHRTLAVTSLVPRFWPQGSRSMVAYIPRFGLRDQERRRPHRPRDQVSMVASHRPRITMDGRPQQRIEP